MCPIWKKSNELFEKIYSSLSPAGPQSLTLYTKKLSTPAEAGLLYLGIKEGWANIPNTWQQSPALVILKQVDEFLFSHLPKVERLATAYKSFKLLKVRLSLFLSLSLSFSRVTNAQSNNNNNSTTSTEPPPNSPPYPPGYAPVYRNPTPLTPSPSTSSPGPLSGSA